MPENPIRQYYEALREASETVLEKTLEDPARVSSVHSEEISDLANWCKLLRGRSEISVLQNAVQEISFGLYALVIGSYRHAFASLRLALEQSLLSIHFSVNRLELAEWQRADYDTNWSSLTGDNGVFSPRYAKSFYPDLKTHVDNYNNSTKQLYRELSEFVHGNSSSWEWTPKKISFDQTVVNDWMAKTSKVAEAITFALVLRFTHELDEQQKAEISDRVITRLGHIEPIRVAYGGARNTL
jgi:hypothetical protein